MGKHVFAARTIDEGIRIISEKYLCYEDYHLLIEVWNWDGLIGKSLIFLTSQVVELSDSDIIQLATRILSLPAGEKTTLSRQEDFTYFNFGFVTD